MKIPNFTLIVITVLSAMATITFGAMALGFPGLVELQCNTIGCKFVVDGREKLIEGD